MQSQISPAVESCLALLAAANEAVISAERAISETTIDAATAARLQANYDEARKLRTIISIRLRAEIAAAQKQ